MLGNDLTYTNIRQENEYPRLLQATVPIPVQALSDSVAAIYTAPDDADFVIDRLYVANVTASAVALRVHFIVSGGIAETANAAFYDVAIPANSTRALSEIDGVRLSPGTQIGASGATANALNVGGSGVEVRGFQE